ncbi:mitochondrial carrier protein MTM1-like isoform X2 [Trifolium pratense]|uniref:mitochondrial carrier protein MTM1-like isoform X2 n=1 Tax=Trifolium pratense TaxID=57577 RepID=UPI001E696AFB|nr:mitochondrial carrier protein MTM1-like isoform X2 [Trifolium pratense]
MFSMAPYHFVLPIVFRTNEHWISCLKLNNRLWRGTNAGLALAVLTVGIYLPCYDIFRNWFEEDTSKSAPTASPYVPLVAGSLARSLSCATCYPIDLLRTHMQGSCQSLNLNFQPKPYTRDQVHEDDVADDNDDMSDDGEELDQD